ncbi:MAG: hypothetical protein Q8P82_01625 [bacterium]|nr:hypothetical protein [bacterium]
MPARASIVIFRVFLAVAGNIFTLQNIWIGTVSFLLLVGGTGWIVGRRVFSSLGSLGGFLGSLPIICWLMIAETIFFYTTTLSPITHTLVLLSLPVIAWVFEQLMSPLPPGEEEPNRESLFSPASAAALAAFLLALAVLIRFLIRSGTTESIRSPWEILPSSFFIVAFIAAVALIILATYRFRFTVLATTLFASIFFSITFFVYPLGFGFDPFIHQATERHIAAQGTITPKPFAYVGQYGFVDLVHTTTNLPVETIDRLLLPLLLSLFLPALAASATRSSLGAPLSLIFPLTTFASTTPQGLGNALALLILFLAFRLAHERRAFLPLWIMGLASAAAHPIAGIPTLLFLFLWSLLRWRKPEGPHWSLLRPFEDSGMRFPKMSGMLVFMATAFGSILLPLLFGVLTVSKRIESGFHADWRERLPAIFIDLTRSIGGMESRFKIFQDFIYTYHLHIVPLFLIGAGVAVILFLKKKQWWILSYPLVAFAAAINGIALLALIDFSFLPSYEQAGYAERLFDLAKLFLFPLVLWGAVRGFERLWRRGGVLVDAGLIALGAALIVTSLYLTYPHHDAYITERGWSVSSADIAAVQFIEKDAGNAPYIVLANQAVSAAALRELGFKKYYKFKSDEGKTVEAFFYPIPTGGPLYQYFLRMSYDAPRRSTMSEALQRTDVSLGYLVVNQYWTNAELLIERAKLEADAWWPIENGAIYIFKFEK